MALGALIVLAVLVAGGIYLPRHSKTEARQGETEKGKLSKRSSGLRGAITDQRGRP